MGFNRECIRAYILWRVFQHFRCTAFVETGTGYAKTAGFARRAFKTTVLTCEVNISNYLISRLNLVWASQVLISSLNSPDFLRKVCSQSQIGSNPMFYLDSHWHEYMPLPDELLIIAECCERGIVVIDDFFIPADPRFGYDQYQGCGLRIDLNIIDTTLTARREDVLVYLPVYDPSKEPQGGARGMAVALIGQEEELPAKSFPFNLLALARDC